MNYTILSVGSNIDPESNVTKARKILAQEHCLLSESTFIWTEPVGFLDQDDFLNGAFYLKTEMECNQFNTYLKEVETRLGRIKTENKAGPRTMDLDIIVWNQNVVHPDFHHSYIYDPVMEIVCNERIKINSDYIGVQ